jgi:succinate dehydrogenase / fumarate reductase membrane anchor subunit
MIDKATIATPTTHYGNPKKATRGFITQGLTGALNILFLAFLVWFVVSIAGTGREHLVETIRNPFVAIVLILLLVNVAVHMRNGMADVIEDYVSEGPRNTLALRANTAFAVIVALVSIVAVLKILFWG